MIIHTCTTVDLDWKGYICDVTRDLYRRIKERKLLHDRFVLPFFVFVCLLQLSVFSIIRNLCIT